MAGENEFLLYSFLMGIFIPFAYDLLRILRRVLPHGSFLVSLEDLAFWVYCGEEVFLLMYHESDGTLRWFAIMGAMVGMFLYRKLVSGWFVKYVSLLLGKVLGWLWKPVAYVGGGIRRACRKVGAGVRRLGGRFKRNVKIRLTYFLKELKIGFKT